MNSSPPGTGHSVLEVRGARASSVIVQRITPDCADAFLDWQRGISSVTAEFPGYQTTEIYPPAGPAAHEWVIVIHFDTAPHLQAWLDSPKRAEWMAKVPCKAQGYRLKMLPSGFGAWFTGLAESDGPLPHWKMFLTVLFALYPTVMLFTFFLSPQTQRFGLAIAMLIGNAASVSFLEWLLMPQINRLFGPWLRANGKEDRTFSFIGLALVIGALGLMTFLFWLVTQPG